MANQDPVEGRLVHENAGIGQQRVGEPGPAPRQKAERPPAAGGPGTGSGSATRSGGEGGVRPGEETDARSG